MRLVAAGAVILVTGTGAAVAALTGHTSSTPTAALTGSTATDVSQGVVDINTTLGYQGSQAAGTGIVLSSSGEILTNNHVVAGATSISVTDVGNGRTYTASVVGTDKTDDVAVIQLQGASGLETAALGDSSKVAVGDAVTGVGNAGGVGGTPSSASGSVTALNQSITASDEGDGSSEQLTGLIQTDAAIQAGDSGGPLVSSSGQVVGMDTAASASGGFQLQSGGSQGFAIPINTALTVAKQIEAGKSSATVHIGPAAFLGVQVQDSSQFAGSSSGSGALVAGVESGSPAEQAGLAAGDQIVSLGGSTVDSPTTLSNLMQRYHPGDSVQLGWIDGSGQQQSATVTLAAGPAV